MFAGETIKEHLDYIAKNFGPIEELDYVDYAIEMAKEKTIEGCGENLNCYFRVKENNERRIEEGVVKFIEGELGEKSSEVEFTLAKADALTRLASKFRDSAEEYYNSDFYREEQRIMDARSIDEIEGVSPKEAPHEDKPSPGCSVSF